MFNRLKKYEEGVIDMVKITNDMKKDFTKQVTAEHGFKV